MSPFLGPLDLIGRVPARQQTRLAAVLISAHGALARQLAFALPQQMKAGWQTELNAQLYRESEIVSCCFARLPGQWILNFQCLPLAGKPRGCRGRHPA